MLASFGFAQKYHRRISSVAMDAAVNAECYSWTAVKNRSKSCLNYNMLVLVLTAKSIELCRSSRHTQPFSVGHQSAAA